MFPEFCVSHELSAEYAWKKYDPQGHCVIGPFSEAAHIRSTPPQELGSRLLFISIPNTAHAALAVVSSWRAMRTM
jgi:hypothetical protein